MDYVRALPDCGAAGVRALQGNADEIKATAQEILDVRRRYLDAAPECTLAILYNPETMPPDLVKAHQKLDALVDKAYGRTFADDAERVAHLFKLYAQCVVAEKDAAK